MLVAKILNIHNDHPLIIHNELTRYTNEQMHGTCNNLYIQLQAIYIQDDWLASYMNSIVVCYEDCCVGSTIHDS